MREIFSNHPDHKDYVLNPFQQMLMGSTCAQLAAPYFTDAEPLIEAAKKGIKVQLLIGLNEITSPKALRICQSKGISIRYFTRRFHAKIYVFDNFALVGSANLTGDGLRANREAVIKLDRDADTKTAFGEARALFDELWESGRVLTSQVLDDFERTYKTLPRRTFDPEEKIEKAIGSIAEPYNINDRSQKKSTKRDFLEALQRQVDEEYRPAFDEVMAILKDGAFRRPELAKVGIECETNRFLNYVRLEPARDKDAWQNAKLLSSPDEREERCDLIKYHADEWVKSSTGSVADDYVDWLENARQTFDTKETIETKNKRQIFDGLMCIHAFDQHLRRTGSDELYEKFWKANNEDLARVKSTIIHLIHGPGEDFIPRLHDVLNDKSRKLDHFGKFIALELYGTIRPDKYPPINGRMAKALRFLGFDVKGE